MASAHRGASLHIVSGPSADEGGDAPLQQRDVIVRTQHKKVEDWRAAHGVYNVPPFFEKVFAKLPPGSRRYSVMYCLTSRESLPPQLVKTSASSPQFGL